MEKIAIGSHCMFGDNFVIIDYDCAVGKDSVTGNLCLVWCKRYNNESGCIRRNCVKIWCCCY